ncbi:hypothetical protein CHLRE_03g154726v5 [Chlamydomonas reinhardtii]|uniref:Uncharacterized protein n=1 Tax=Chlamydomonas reinhardtii TaxID=3055 RepID=A0A2K3DVX9_CHLRE|nr:uncharacterized protein CHLRE_03g154726v5 [Chlamydomonas reinhardtii]PNW84690.1 hypothetical protein CHLRE_03g154726v5 [Chlamydomonas reinhardtii]
MLAGAFMVAQRCVLDTLRNWRTDLCADVEPGARSLGRDAELRLQPLAGACGPCAAYLAAA